MIDHCGFCGLLVDLEQHGEHCRAKPKGLTVAQGIRLAYKMGGGSPPYTNACANDRCYLQRHHAGACKAWPPHPPITAHKGY